MELQFASMACNVALASCAVGLASVFMGCKIRNANAAAKLAPETIASMDGRCNNAGIVVVRAPAATTYGERFANSARIKLREACVLRRCH